MRACSQGVPSSLTMYRYLIPWISLNWSISDCSVDGSRLRMMSRLELAIVCAMAWLLASYSSESCRSTVYTHSADVDTAISPKSAKIPNIVF